MSHELTIREDGTAEMFSGSNIVPWHKLGTVIPGLATAKEAIQLAKLGWKANLTPVYVNGAKVDGYSAVTRSDNAKVLSIVGGRYSPIHNEDAFDFFDSVVGGGQAVYDTAGSLFGGKKVWIMAKLTQDFFVRPGDKITENVLLYTSHDGSSALVMKCVATRCVCNNTVSMALRETSSEIKIRHTRSYKEKVGEAVRALGICNAYFTSLAEVMAGLEAKPMSNPEMVSFSEKLVPSKDEQGEDSTRTRNIRDSIVGLFSRGKGNLGRTRFDALNAVTEFADHYRATRSSGDNATESRFASSIFGSGAALKAKALDLLSV